MSDYTEYVVPGPDNWRTRPSREQLAAILDALGAGGWLLAAEEHRPELGGYVSPDSARDLLRSIPPDQCLNLYLEGRPELDDWPEEQPELSAAVCEDLRIIDSPMPLIVPSGDLDLEVPCSACKADILRFVRRLPPSLEGDDVSNPYPWLAANGYHLAPGACPACQAPLEHASMAVYSHEEPLDEVPFFNFGIALSPALSPPDDFTIADPGLLEALQQLIGVSFRSIGRWG